jgi:hypothetical protein
MLSIAATRSPGSSIPRVTTAIWVGLGIFLLAIVAGMAFVGYEIVRGWRQFRGLPRLAGELDRLNRNVLDVQRRVANMERQLADLQRQVDGLSVTLGRARVLAGAAREVRETVASVRGFFPTK